MLNNKLDSTIIDLENKLFNLYNELVKSEYQENKKDINKKNLR